jgi:hypothetical protein
MSQQKDDLEAVRIVADALGGFDPKDQERIIRWAREKLGLPAVPANQLAPTPRPPASGVAPSSVSAPQASTSRDLKSFVAEKQPKNDVQFAATVAYYHRFEAPENLRRTEISADDLQEACRLVGRERFKSPYQTLRNAHTLGLLNQGDQRGAFAVNSVGENLVAVTLPGDGSGVSRTTKKRAKQKGQQRKAARNPARK